MLVLGLIFIIIIGVIGLALLCMHLSWCFLSTRYMIMYFECFKDRGELPKYKEFIKSELEDIEIEELIMGCVCMAGGHLVCLLIGIVILLPFVV